MASRVLARLTSIAALLVAAWILVRPAAAEARRRIVVLELEGDSAEEFHDDLVKFLKKSHSVVPLGKWMSAAEALSATKVTDKNVKKVAKKLSIDGVVAGEIEKRGSRYYVRLVLRDGTTGKTVTTTELVERAARFSTEGKSTLTDELLTAIDELSSSGDDDDGDDEGFGGTGMRGRDDDEDDERASKAARARAAKEKAAREKAAKEKAARAKARRDRDRDEDDEDDERVADADADDDGRGRRRGRRGDDEDDDGGDEEDIEIEGDEDLEAAVDPRTRPLDLAAGLSVTARRLSFDSTSMTPPNGYKSNPVAGVTIAADLFPLAFNRKNRSITRNLGLSFVVDRVIKMQSQYRASDDMIYELATTEQHYGIGAIYRHLVGKNLTVNVSVRFNNRKFVIDASTAPTPAAGDIPTVSYSYVDPGVGVRYLVNPKTTLGADVRYLVVTDTGAVQSAARYGDTSAGGLDLGARFEYQVGAKLLVRASAGLARFGLTFDGNGALTTSGEIKGATDLYIGGALVGVYLF